MIAVKKATIIRIDAQILKRAKELGLNITKVCENALKLYINALENANQKIATNLTNTGSNPMELPDPRQSADSRAGFEPATTALPRRCPTRLGYRGLTPSPKKRI